MKGEAVRIDSQNDLLDAEVAPKEPSVFASRVSDHWTGKRRPPTVLGIPLTSTSKRGER